MILSLTGIFSLNSINQLIFVMVKSCVFCAVWTEFLRIIWTSFSSKGLISVVDGGERVASRPSHFVPGQVSPGTHWLGGWVGHSAVLGVMEKRKIPATVRNRTPVVQPVASH
jgi:hypothetical protein